MSQNQWFVNHLASAFTVKDAKFNYCGIVNEPALCADTHEED